MRGDIVNATTGFTLTPTMWGESGYSIVGKATGQRSVHRLVVEAFTGEIPEGLVVNHLDGNKQNNHISNLEICTPAENMQHAYATGLAKGLKGEDNSMNKFQEKEILTVYSLIKKGYSNLEIDRVTGIPWKHVSLLRKGKRWKYLFEREGMKESFSTGNLPYNFNKCVYILNYCMVSNLNNKELVVMFELDRPTVSRIRGRKTWKSLFVHLDL